MTNEHLTPVAIDKAANYNYPEWAAFNGMNAVIKDREHPNKRLAFISGANYVLSHLPEEKRIHAIGFAEWAGKNGYFYSHKRNAWSRPGSDYLTHEELHAEYLKWLESNNQ